MHELTSDLTLLWQLLAIDSPSGDEGLLADWLIDWITAELPDVRLERLGDSILALKGEQPSVAIFSHIDTTGFTLGYGKRLIPIGGPSPKDGEPLQSAGESTLTGVLTNKEGRGWRLTKSKAAQPGSRWVYSTTPRQEKGEIIAPYLDNRAGVWAALQALKRCERIAVALTVGEEHSGQGAYVCGRRLYEGYGITQALISDITWDTKYVHCGKGVAISLRDRMVPRQRFLNRVLALAEASGLPYQREIETEGSSDGGYLLRSGVSIDWVFVGAPERNPHTSSEHVTISDLVSMADMLTFLTNGLTETPGY